MTRKKKPPKIPISKVVVYGDVHDPFADEPVFDMFLEALRIIRPDCIIENGDGFDMYQLSKFSKDPRRALELAEDREVFCRHRKMISDAVGRQCVKHYLAGNHEGRMQDYLKRKAPELAYLEELETGQFLRLEQMGWDYRANDEKIYPEIDVGQLLVTHGLRTNLHADKLTMEDYGGSTLTNHTHRMGSFWKTDASTTHVGYMNGHLSDPKQAKYANIKKWVQGFSVVSVDDETGWFRVHQIPIVKVPGRPIKRMMLHEGVLECPA